jgi:hypothetical protein
MPNIEMIIPPNERSADLKAKLFGFAEQVAVIRDTNPNLAAQQPRFFSFLTYPWLVQAEGFTQEQIGYLERRKIEIAQLGFDGHQAKNDLLEILRNDKHLRECCPTPFQLATHFDSYFVTFVGDLKRQRAPKERMEFAFDEFESLTYHQGRFRRIAISHLFNFQMTGNGVTFTGREPVGDVRIERLDSTTIPAILGESGSQAFLHPPAIGDCFIFDEGGSSDLDDGQWLEERRVKASFFAQVLQYLKDGVIHLGYSVPAFLPAWAGQVRRSGLFFLGEPRRIPYESGRRPYVLDDPAKEQMNLWWKAATAKTITAALANQKGKLRQAIWRAGDYYELSHRQPNPVERLISIAISFEALFSPSDQAELNFRICQTAAQFVGGNPVEKQNVFMQLKEMYSLRSKIVHGTYDLDKYVSGKFVTAEAVDVWAGYLRRALIRFLAIYLKGHTTAERDQILNRISEVNFDDSKAIALGEESDIEAYFCRVVADV